MLIPPNVVTVTATIRKGEDEITTSIMVQTHKIEEIKYALELAWKGTNDNTPKIIVDKENDSV